MAYHPARLGAFTFSASESNFVRYVESCEALSVFASSSSGVFTVQVSPIDSTSTGTGDWQDLQSAGSDVTITAPNVLAVSPLPFRRMRLLSTFGSTGSTGVVTGAGGTGFAVVGQVMV